MRYLVFTDLDGTLLDHHTYSGIKAEKALKDLNASGIPVIFCSSKTFEEQVLLQKKLKTGHPFIVENGSAIVFPATYFAFQPENSTRLSDKYNMIVLAKKDINDIHVMLKNINEGKNNPWYGFSDATLKEIGEATGLKGAAINRAKERWFTETMLSPPPTTSVNSILESNGFCLSRGGRFLTIQDKTIDKGKAATLVVQLFAKLWNSRIISVGIGDSLNDAALLKVVDKPFLVQKPDKTWAAIDIQGLTNIEGVGPEGFLMMANSLLTDIN